MGMDWTIYTQTMNIRRLSYGWCWRKILIPETDKIIYDEKEKMFGLATPGTEKNQHPIFIGYYGDFLDAYMGI